MSKSVTRLTGLLLTLLLLFTLCACTAEKKAAPAAPAEPTPEAVETEKPAEEQAPVEEKAPVEDGEPDAGLQEDEYTDE